MARTATLMCRRERQGALAQVGDKLIVGASAERPGFEVHRVQRGGKITHHCPGQLVGYAIVDLSRHTQDIAWFLRALEQALIDLLAEYGVRAHTLEGLTGVWVDGAKIAAIGVSASRYYDRSPFPLYLTSHSAAAGSAAPESKCQSIWRQWPPDQSC